MSERDFAAIATELGDIGKKTGEIEQDEHIREQFSAIVKEFDERQSGKAIVFKTGGPDAHLMGYVLPLGTDALGKEFAHLILFNDGLMLRVASPQSQYEEAYQQTFSASEGALTLDTSSLQSYKDAQDVFLKRYERYITARSTDDNSQDAFTTFVMQAFTNAHERPAKVRLNKEATNRRENGLMAVRQFGQIMPRRQLPPGNS